MARRHILFKEGQSAADTRVCVGAAAVQILALPGTPHKSIHSWAANRCTRRPRFPSPQVSPKSFAVSSRAVGPRSKPRVYALTTA
jgi:hypothetical protein